MSKECVLKECVATRPSYGLSLYELPAGSTLAYVLDSIELRLL